jgi:lipoate-protein ligase A
MTKTLFPALEVYRDTVPHSAALNMSIDEALLEHARVPSIRFYRWHSPALSFGYFGRFSDVARCTSGRDVVRRWTGGGIVWHGEDLTYGLVIPAGDCAFNESSVVIYERVHRALCEALNATGECAVLAAAVDPGSGNTGTPAAVTSSGYSCFANPVPADVMVCGRKVAGAAQRRTRRGLLQQGSIQGADLDSKLAKRFAEALSANRTDCETEEQILIRARELAQQKYGSDSWLRRR